MATHKRRDIRDAPLTRGTEIASNPRCPGPTKPQTPVSGLHLARSESVYHRIVSRAADARREQFRVALERGHSIEEIAAATGLDADEVTAVLAP